MRALATSLLVFGLLAFLPESARAQQCQTYNLPELVTLTGTLDSTDCVMSPIRNSRGEFWNVFLNAGETAVITMNRVTMADPYLYLLNPSGAVVASNDDEMTGFRNAKITYVAAATGMHRVVATAFVFQPQTDDGTFEIRLEITGHPGCQVRNLPVATTMNATLDNTDCIVQPYRAARGEIWTFTATAGNTITINMNRFTMQDPFLVLLNAAWQILETNDDVGGTFDARITFVATYTGTYRVVATSSLSMDTGAYSIRFESSGPPPPTGLPGPTGQPSVAIVGSQVTISWTAPTTGATPILEYLLEVGNTAGGSELGTYSMGGATQVVASFPNGTFYVRLRARNSVGTGPASAERAFTVGTIVILNPPRSLTVVVTGRAVTLNWQHPVDGAPDIYRIEVGTGPGLSNLAVVDIPGGFTTAGNPDAPPGLYYVRIRAVRGSAVSNPSNEVVVLVF